MSPQQKPKRFKEYKLVDACNALWQTTEKERDAAGKVRVVRVSVAPGVFPPWMESVCREGVFAYRHQQYVRVFVKKRLQHHHHHHKHGPPVHWIRMGDRYGFVPAHPADVKGKPPVNLKHGVFLLGSDPHVPVERSSLKPSEKYQVLERPPKELVRSPAEALPDAAHPRIEGHLLSESGHHPPAAGEKQEKHEILYDYKSREFVYKGFTSEGNPAKFAVGEVSAHGRSSGVREGSSPLSGGEPSRAEGRSSSGGEVRSGTSSTSSASSSRESATASSGVSASVSNASGTSSSSSGGGRVRPH